LGAVLIDDTGKRFMANEPGAELAARDNRRAAPSLGARRADGHRTFLDARKHPGKEFAQRYPVISAFLQNGRHRSRDRIRFPVRPAGALPHGRAFARLIIDGAQHGPERAVGPAARSARNRAARRPKPARQQISLMEAIVPARAGFAESIKGG